MVNISSPNAQRTKKQFSQKQKHDIPTIDSLRNPLVDQTTPTYTALSTDTALHANFDLPGVKKK